MILDREVIKKLAGHLSLYNYYKEEILDLEEEIINSSIGDINGDIRSKNKVSKSVENTAIRLASDEKLTRLKNIVNAIDDLRIELLEEPVLLKILNYKYMNQSYIVRDIPVMMKIEEQGYPMGRNEYYKLKEQILYKFERKLEARGVKI